MGQEMYSAGEKFYLEDKYSAGEKFYLEDKPGRTIF